MGLGTGASTSIGIGTKKSANKTPIILSGFSAVEIVQRRRDYSSNGLAEAAGPGTE
jgi:hypothetical protein